MSQTVIDENKHLILFTNCFAVNGASRSVIVDTERNQIFFISNELYSVITETREKKWKDILQDYDESSHSTLIKFVEFLELNELCFWTDEPHSFPQLNEDWDYPALITNAIIDADASSNHDWAEIFRKLIEVGCRDIQLRFFDSIKKNEIEHILCLLTDSYIKSVELIVKYCNDYSKRYLDRLIDQHTRIKTILVHSSPLDEAYRFRNDTGSSGMGNILFVKQVIASSNDCGIVNMDYFTFSSSRTFMEFKKFNSCLNRKIGVDKDGSIKNCPAMKESFGHISDLSIRDIITPDFKKSWFINKDQIDICKVCEFRYVCSDCRAFTKKANDIYSKPLKCNYDPYQMQWNEVTS